MAATLTEAQLELFRLDIGQVDCEVYTDPQLQAAYDAADGNDCGARAIVSRWLWAKAEPAKINLANGGTAFSNSRIKAAYDRMKYWESCAGTAGATMSLGVLGLGLDAVVDNDAL